MKTLTRNQLFEAIGTRPSNPRWSWCAIAENKERSVFTLWEDLIKNNEYQILGPLIDKRNIRGYNDLKKILNVVIAEGVPSYGIECIAEDPKANPRKIKSAINEYLIPLRFYKKKEFVYAKLGEKIPFANVTRGAFKKQDNALLDIAEPPSGSDSPDRALRSGFVVKRDPKVRKYVMDLAKGKCEYCRELGFAKTNGGFYLEAHHIIALGNIGKDTVENVIALCPNHHRQAHFGADAEKLENKFVTIVRNRNKII